MSEFDQLYREVILDHYKNPRGHGLLEDPDAQAEGQNPLCGDRVTVYLAVEGDRIADVSFEGRGCAISTAAASLMTEVLKGKTVAEARALFAQFHARVTGGEPALRPRRSKPGRWRSMGSSSPSFPASRSCMIATLVKSLEIEAMR